MMNEGIVSKKRIELTTQGKWVLGAALILIVGIVLFFIFGMGNNKIKAIFLETEILDVGDSIEYEGSDIIVRMHMDSSVQLSSVVYPTQKKQDIKFNNYDKDIISIDSEGLLRGKKVGQTTLQIGIGKILSNKVTIYVY